MSFVNFHQFAPGGCYPAPRRGGDVATMAVGEGGGPIDCGPPPTIITAALGESGGPIDCWPQPATPTEQPNVFHLKDVFSTFDQVDRNHDGQITAAEITADQGIQSNFESQQCRINRFLLTNMSTMTDSDKLNTGLSMPLTKQHIIAAAAQDYDAQRISGNDIDIMRLKQNPSTDPIAATLVDFYDGQSAKMGFNPIKTTDLLRAARKADTNHDGSVDELEAQQAAQFSTGRLKQASQFLADHYFELSKADYQDPQISHPPSRTLNARTIIDTARHDGNVRDVSMQDIDRMLQPAPKPWWLP